MGALGGALAAVTAPIFMVVGFIFWETHWHGSPFELNVFKCILASILFLAFAIFTDLSRIFAAPLWSHAMLILSSVLGIVIGDNTWLLSLKMIGARRVIVVDSLGPFMGALLGHMILGEHVGPLGVVGMVITLSGVMVCALEQEHPEEGSVAPRPAGVLARGYLLAFINVLFDAIGSLLTKMYGEEPLNPFDINLIRFGSAAFIMSAMYSCSYVIEVATKRLGISHPRVWLKNPDSERRLLAKPSGMEFAVEEQVPLKAGDTDGAEGMELSHRTRTPGAVQGISPMTNPNTKPFAKPDLRVDTKWAPDEEGGNGVSGGGAEETPIRQRKSTPYEETLLRQCDRGILERQVLCMSVMDWLLVTLGILMVTVTYPELFTYAILEIHLGVCLTLASLGPIYAIPLTYYMKGEPITVRACVGACFAVVGVFVLFMYT